MGRDIRSGSALLFAAIVVACAGGCGGDSSESPAANAGGGAVASDEQQVRAVLSSMGKAMGRKDFGAVCDLMTRQARAQMAAAGKQIAASGGGSATDDGDPCAAAFTAYQQGAVTEDLSPRILSVKVRGDSAAVVAQPSHDRKPQTARLQREGGEWRVVIWYTN